MALYLYSAFLVLLTTQSALQYSFTFTHSHTHSYSASITSTLLFYGGLFRVQHLAQGHVSMQIWKTGDRTADLRPLYPSATAAPMSDPEYQFMIWVMNNQWIPSVRGRLWWHCFSSINLKREKRNKNEMFSSTKPRILCIYSIET